MDSSRVVITKQKDLADLYSLDNEIGLSTYDLALISIDKIQKRKKLSINKVSKNTYLI